MKQIIGNMEAVIGRDNFFLRYATVIAIAAVTIIMLLAAGIFYVQTKVSDTAQQLVVHTYEVTGHIQLMFNRLKDVELGERGFIIGGDEKYLEPYYDALTDARGDDAGGTKLASHHSIAQELAILRSLTSDNPVQQQNLDEMAKYLGQLLSYWQEIIETRKHQHTRKAAAQVDFGKGNELMDDARRLVSIMQAEENRLLDLRTHAEAKSERRHENLIFCGIVLFYAMQVLAICLYQRSRARAQAQLLRYTRELEEREEELKTQQEELKASNEEIESSNEELEEKTRALEKQNAQIQLQSEELTESQRLIERKAQELERVNQYKSEFLANMSHELRTPLNSLLILARLLAANEEKNLTASQVEDASIIYNGGLELLSLINDILDLSKIEAGKLAFNAEETSLHDIVKRLEQQFIPVAKQAGVAFPVIMEEGLPSTLYTDAHRVEQIVKNLLSNAFKFTANGSVMLKVHRPDSVQRAELEQENTIAFSVADTGIGIENTKLKDIFEAFQQENGSIDRHYGGTGLGLTIARKFAHILGGEIHVASEKGKGSTFSLLLPVRMEMNETQEQELLPTPVPENIITLKSMPRHSMPEFIPDDRQSITEKDKVMLIIEDDANFAKVLMKMAHRHGYKCIAAGDGKSGLLYAAEEKVTAIILDLTLPDIDGMNVLSQLKHNMRTRHIPVHIISGREEVKSTLPLGKGAVGYLAKPAGKDAIDDVFTRLNALLAFSVKHVLVVEDDLKNQVAIQKLLQKQDVEITAVGLGSTALEEIGHTQFDCIILDLTLPDMSGLQWLKRLEQEMKGKPVPPVIIYTAKELTEDENRQLSQYTGSIIIKGAKSPERLLDEVTLFLHCVESTLSREQQDIIRMQHDPDTVLRGRTLLLTDDDLRNTFALSKLLKSHGMNVLIADNGQMALNILGNDHSSVELVIMDIMMPVMDGYHAMRAIRTQTQFRHLPIIALTARAMPEEQEKCMAAGANDYLTKPVDTERLLSLLRVWLFKQERAA